MLTPITLQQWQSISLVLSPRDPGLHLPLRRSLILSGRTVGEMVPTPRAFSFRSRRRCPSHRCFRGGRRSTVVGVILAPSPPNYSRPARFPSTRRHPHHVPMHLVVQAVWTRSRRGSQSHIHNMRITWRTAQGSINRTPSRRPPTQAGSLILNAARILLPHPPVQALPTPPPYRVPISGRRGAE